MKNLSAIGGRGGKVLGQVQPTPINTWVNLYTVPSGKSAEGSTLVVCNIGIASALWRLAVRPAGTAIANKHYQFFDVTIDPGKTQFFTDLGWELQATDVIDVYTSFVAPSFTVYGAEGV